MSTQYCDECGNGPLWTLVTVSPLVAVVMVDKSEASQTKFSLANQTQSDKFKQMFLLHFVVLSLSLLHLPLCCKGQHKRTCEWKTFVCLKK